MTDQKATVRRYFDAFAAGDVERALGCIQPDAVWHIDGDPALVTVGIVRGHAAIREWLTRFGTGFQPLAFSIDHIIGEGDEIVAIGRFRHRIVSTGAIVDSDYAIRFTLRDGLICHYQIFEDSLLLSHAHHDASPARSAIINGTSYGWDDVGKGPPLIFLHGLFLSRHFWSRQVATLAKDNRCLCFDMPGHGRSGWRDGLDLDGIADDIALWIAEHGAEPATLVGHSMGGMIAMRVASKHPKLVDRLVLMNTSAREEYSDRLPAWRTRKAALLASDAERLILFEEIQRLKATSGWLAANEAEARDELEIMRAHNPVLLAKALEAAVLSRHDIRDQLPLINAVTIVLSGVEDRATPACLGHEIAELIKGAEHQVLDAVAHSIPIECGDALNTVIARRIGGFR